MQTRSIFRALSTKEEITVTSSRLFVTLSIESAMRTYSSTRGTVHTACTTLWLFPYHSAIQFWITTSTRRFFSLLAGLSVPFALVFGARG